MKITASTSVTIRTTNVPSPTQLRIKMRATRNLTTLPAMALALVLGAAALPARADINWDGDGGQGNFTWCENWYGNSCPTQPWQFSYGNLVFNYRNNTSQTSLYYDASFGWGNNIGDIIWETTFAAGLTLNGAGNGINFNQRVENRSAYAQTVNIPLSGAKNGAAQIELNPVNGDLTISANLYNDNNKPFFVYGSNSKMLTIGQGLTGDSSVSLTIVEYSKVKLAAAQTWGDSTHGVNIHRGELWIDSGGSLKSGVPVNLGLGDANTAKLWLSVAGGGTTVGQNITVANSGGIKVIGGLNTSGTHTFTGNITLNGPVNLVADRSGGTVEFKTGVISGGSSVNINTTATSAGKVTLSGANTYSGLTTVSAGTLTLGATTGTAGVNAFGGDLTINGSGTVNYLAGTKYNNQIPDAAIVTLNSPACTLDFAAQSETIGQTSPSVAGGFTMNDGYVSMVSGVVKLAGSLRIHGGTVKVWGAGTLQADQDLVFNGGTIDIATLSGTGNFNLRGGNNTGITYESSGTSTARISHSSGHGKIGLNGDATTVFEVEDSPSVATELQIEVPLANSGTTSSIRKEGAGRLLLSQDSGSHDAASTYTGATTINGGTFALGVGASINNSASISIAAGATFDVSAITPYALSTSTSLSAGGTGTGSTAAVIKGALGGIVNLGARPVSLTYTPIAWTGDSTHPALYISQGTLSLNGNSFTVNNASGTPLGYGIYTIAQQASGNITSAGSYSVSVVGSGKVASSMASVSVTGGTVLLTIACASPTVLTMSGTGTFCTAAGSQTLGVSGATESDVTYALKNGSTTVESKSGTGSSISFSPVSAAGTYTVVGTRGTCSTPMSGTATINAGLGAPSPNVSYSVALPSSLKIRISELLGQWTGTSLSVASVGNSTQGGTVTKDSTFIYYIAPTSPTSPDTIPYTVSGENGCTTAAQIDVVFVAPAGGQAQMIEVVAGKATVKFSGIPGYTYIVERAEDANFTVNATPVLTNNAPPDGLFTFEDQTSLPQAYYRLKHSP